MLSGWMDVDLTEHGRKELEELRRLIKETGSGAVIEIDGGVNMETGRLLKDGGADILVAGNYIFSSPDPLAAIHGLKQL